MKKLFTLILFFIGFVTFSQTDDNPILVTPTVEKVSDTEYDLIFNITIADDWHLYSQYNPEDASLPMTITPSEGQLLESGEAKITPAKVSLAIL